MEIPEQIPTLAPRPEPPVRRPPFKRKKNKLSPEAPSGRGAANVAPLSAKYFSVFARNFESLDELLKEVDALNKNCEREFDSGLQEVDSTV